MTKLRLFSPYCAVRGLYFTWLPTFHTKLSETYPVQCGTAPFKVEKVILSPETSYWESWIRHWSLTWRRGKSWFVILLFGLLGAIRLVAEHVTWLFWGGRGWARSWTARRNPLEHCSNTPVPHCTAVGELGPPAAPAFCSGSRSQTPALLLYLGKLIKFPCSNWTPLAKTPHGQFWLSSAKCCGACGRVRALWDGLRTEELDHRSVSGRRSHYN